MPAVERRSAPRPVLAPRGYVQELDAGQAQWICAMCGAYEQVTGKIAARTNLYRHLGAYHEGQCLMTGPASLAEDPRSGLQPAT